MQKGRYALGLLLFVLFLSSSARADFLFSSPKIGPFPTTNLEMGSTVRITISYRNNYGKEMVLSGASLFLDYDPALIDEIMKYENLNPLYLVELEADHLSEPGRIKYKLKARPGAPEWRIPNGVSRDLLTLTFHLNQAYPREGTFTLFKWSAAETSQVYWDVPIPGTNFRCPPVNIYASKPPRFEGLNSAASRNAALKMNVGNTVLVDWKTSAPAAFSLTPYENGKLHYRIWRATRSDFTDAVLISPDDPKPFLGNVPYNEFWFMDGPGTGAPDVADPLKDGQLYFYKVTAINNASPNAMEAIPARYGEALVLDLTPPGEVIGLTAVSEDRKIVLKWQNPTDADLGGIMIVRSESSLSSFPLVSAQPSPPRSGKEYPPGTLLGNGMVIYISPQENYDPVMVQQEYEDYEVANGRTYHYRVFTYDRAIPDQELGYNWSRGKDITATAGVTPAPPSNFCILPGASPGEVTLRWDNSTSDFAGGVLVRYSTDTTSKFLALIDQNSGRVAVNQPAYAGAGREETVNLLLSPNTTYYFKAFAYNQSDETLDPDNPLSIGRHLFSAGVGAMYIVPTEGEKVEDLIYTFTKPENSTGINTFSLPLNLTAVKDPSGAPIDISTVEKLLSALDQGNHVIGSLGWWDEAKQEAVGMIKIDWSKSGDERYTFTPGILTSTPTQQGRAYQVTVSKPTNPSAALTYTVRFKIFR